MTEETLLLHLVTVEQSWDGDSVGMSQWVRDRGKGDNEWAVPPPELPVLAFGHSPVPGVSSPWPSARCGCRSLYPLGKQLERSVGTVWYRAGLREAAGVQGDGGGLGSMGKALLWALVIAGVGTAGASRR